MDRLEVHSLLRAAPGRAVRAAPLHPGISLDDSLDEEAFLKALEEALQQHVASLPQQFLVLSSAQVDRLAFRLHDALVPKRDADTRVIQAWTIQPQLQLKVKASSHIQVLKLSTILREVQRLRVHQIGPPLETDGTPQRAPIEIEIFPSLKVVEALNTEAAALQNAHFFARQLRELHIEYSEMSALQQLLAPKAEKDESGHLQAMNWRRLVKLQMNCCALEVVDDSVNLLKAVRTLDLGWNQIERFDAAVMTRSLETLNLCHNLLREMPPINALRSLRELDLAVNKVKSLKGIESLTGLERLDVSHNKIANVDEVELLMRLPRLAFLKMEFNPIARRPDYRREVLFYLGEIIELDKQPWSEAERSSMKDRRMLLMVDHDKIRNESMWMQSVEAPEYPKVHVRSGIVVKSPKLIMGYPVLPQTQDIPAHYVEIQNPPPIMPTHKAASVLKGTSGGDDKQATVQTVNDYFKTQRGVIISKGRAEEKVSRNTGDTNEVKEESNDQDEMVTAIRGKRARTRSRKYTASDFMRDFEEEESLQREGDVEEIEVRLSRSSSHAQIPSPQHSDYSISVRVLLSAKEAAEYDLHFGIDGVPATIDIKPPKLIERFALSEDRKPVVITRLLSDVVAIGTSIHASRAKIVTMKLRSRESSSVADAAYQIDTMGSLETLLSTLVVRLCKHQKGHVVICTCASCGAISVLTNSYLKRSDADNLVMVYACLLCSSCNVREISFKKLVVLFASEGISIPSAIPLAPPPWEAMTEGYYIEEPVADPGMHECVFVSSNGIREVSFAQLEDNDSQYGSRGVHGDEWNDAIVNAMAAR